ncbi:MAG: hypothetical protein ACOYZ7_19575 [Chloroflexota bacterium]
MKKAVAWAAALINLILVLVWVGNATGQVSDDGRSFITGFVVRAEFLEFFESHGGLEILGYPITTEFQQDGRLVQYFQRARLELHPENPAGRRVLMGELSESLIVPEPPLDETAAHAESRYFSASGHSVAAAFLRYYESRGGADLFGFPITEMMVEEGRIVQYFQRARLDWHPDNPPSLRVQPGRLGEIYLAKYPPPPEVLDPTGGGSQRIDLPDVQALEIMASVSHPFAGQNQPQTLYVFVYDQDVNPLPGASVEAVLRFPQRDQTVVLADTNDLGLTWLVFDMDQIAVGEKVIVDVTVRYGGVEASTQTSFVVWL